MRLTRCKDQKSKTLEEFYAELVREDGYAFREGGRAMLDLIERLRALPNDKCVFSSAEHDVMNHALRISAVDGRLKTNPIRIKMRVRAGLREGSGWKKKWPAAPCLLSVFP